MEILTMYGVITRSVLSVDVTLALPANLPGHLSTFSHKMHVLRYLRQYQRPFFLTGRNLSGETFLTSVKRTRFNVSNVTLNISGS